MKKIYNFLNCILCNFVLGHTQENHLDESEYAIYTKRCKRCHATLMNGYMFKMSHLPPPNSTPKQVKRWKKRCELQEQQLRDTCNIGTDGAEI